ncbi:unnamed protein product [Mycena citricolor]|uniref:Uncharacterized protein n=1 Tax=Mycena citricolor TaxID=2018698 RepID=A0AAD2HLG6_9AGAR|nr:unnamed protein product [Mycena citricolor]
MVIVTTSSKKRKSTKKERGNLRLWAEGVREEILQKHLNRVSEARLGGTWAQERAAIQAACNEYHARIPWSTPDHVEPDVVHDYDPKAPAPFENLTEEEEKEKRRFIAVSNARITRWYAYRIRCTLKKNRENILDPRKNPFAILLGKLSGLTRAPRARQPFQQFQRESWADKIAPVVAVRRAELPSGAPYRAGFRAGVARELFAGLTEEEREGLKQRATAEAEMKKQEYLDGLKAEPSREPLDVHNAIRAIRSVMNPILEGIHKRTGLQAHLICGGPTPEFGGEIRTHIISYGENNDAVPVSWAEWDEERFTQNVRKFFIEYLHTVYTAEDTAAAALPQHVLDTLIHQGDLYTMPKEKPRGDDGPSSDNDDDDEDVNSTDSDSDMDAVALANAVKKKKARYAKEKSGKGSSTTKQKAGKSVKKHMLQPKPKTMTNAASSSASTQTELTLPTSSPTLPAPSSSPATPSTAPAPPPSPGAGSHATSPSSLSAPSPANSRSPSPVSSRAPSPTTITYDSPMGPITYADPWAHLPYEKLTYNQQRQRLAARNAALRDALDLNQATARAMAGDVNKAKVVKRKASEKQTPLPPEKRRRSSRFQTGGVEVPAGGAGRSGSQCGEGDVMEIDISDADDVPAHEPDTDDVPTPEPDTDDVPAPALPDADNVPTPEPDTDDVPAPALPDVSENASPGAGVPVAAETTGDDDPDPNADTNVDKATAIAGANDAVVTRPRPRCPVKAAVWFQDAHKRFITVDLGVNFDSVIAAWTRVEEASRYAASDAGLATEHRPAAVTTWIRGKRNKIPRLPNIDAYAMQWDRWWSSLQPEWRVKDTVAGAGWSRVTYGGDGREWGPLYIWGPNGTQSLLGALYMWGIQLRETGTASQRASWEEAVQDVGWMLEGLATYYELWKKKGAW